MKRLFTFLLLVLLTTALSAQFTSTHKPSLVENSSGSYKLFSFNGVLDSVNATGSNDSLVSNAFSLTGFEGTDTKFTWKVEHSADSATIYIKGANSLSETFYAVDTVCTNNTVNTPYPVVLDFNNYRFRFYKVYFYSNNDAATITFDDELYLVK